MRLFLIFANHGAETANTITELQKHSHQVLYWVGAFNREVKNFPEIIFHNYKDARRGIPAPGIEVWKYPPPSADLVRRLYGVESIVMTMTNKVFPYLSFEEHKHLYYDLLRYWQGVLEEFRPDAIIFPISPANNYNYLLYSLAKLSGIKTIMFSDTPVSDRTFVHFDPWEPSPKLSQILQQNQGKQFSLNELSPDLQTYYLKQTGKDTEEAKPWYLKLDRRRYLGFNNFRRKLKIFGKNLISPRLFVLAYRFFASRLGPNAWKEYREYQVRPDYQRKFVYIPLQYQPERTTVPLGEIFADLIFMIETVAATLPEQWIVYVKEHPVQWWRQGRKYSPFRYRGYYEKIARIPKVFLVPIETDNYELIDRSQAVATVTGTPGWEAILRRKPAVIFGYPWYRDCPLVFKVEDVATCRAAFEKIRNGFKIKAQAVINFLKSFDDATIHCSVDDPFNTDISQLTTGQRLRNLSEAIISELHV